MNDETVLFYAKQIKKFCEQREACEGCPLSDTPYRCRVSPRGSWCPDEWNLPEESKKYKVYKTVMDYDKDECYDIEYDGVLYDTYEEANEVLNTLHAGVVKTVFTKYQKGVK